MKSNQKTFDTIVEHMRKQGVRSVDETGKCAYRGKDGLKCAVGCLIPDDDYKPEFERNSATYPPIWNILSSLGHSPHLCLALQGVHDHYAPKDWEITIRRVADDFELKYTPPERL